MSHCCRLFFFHADDGIRVLLRSRGLGDVYKCQAWNDAEAREGFDRSKSEAASSFGDDRIFIEKLIEEPRHSTTHLHGDRTGLPLIPL